MSLRPPDDVHVAVAVHHGEVAGVHPPVGVDGLGGALRVVPVADHHRVAAGAQLAGLAGGDRAVGVVDRRRCGPPRADARARRWRCGGGASRRAASGSTPATSPSCRSRWSPRPCASGRCTAFITSTGHGEPAITPVRSDVRSKRLEVAGGELGDEHRGHAVERGAALGLDRLRAPRRGRTPRPGSPSWRRAWCSRGCPSPCRSSGRRAPGCTGGRRGVKPCSSAVK